MAGRKVGLGRMSLSLARYWGLRLEMDCAMGIEMAGLRMLDLKLGVS